MQAVRDGAGAVRCLLYSSRADGRCRLNQKDFALSFIEENAEEVVKSAGERLLYATS